MWIHGFGNWIKGGVKIDWVHINAFEIWWGQREHAKTTRRWNAWYEIIEHNQGEMQGIKNEVKSHNL